ncbi:galectin-1-like [Boleophthalmus pectinirostris]|uniref:galectin-1-like n=1 Tax=Boleophthalmus pectinirostris TaxID=150288 RepID=UPI00242C0B84|nr:galectin-1-like [Boleophthalmus pectinirostris]
MSSPSSYQDLQSPELSTPPSSGPVAEKSAKMDQCAMIVKNMSFKVGQTLTLVGTIKPNPTRFSVNIGPNENNIAIHVNPRFNYGCDQNTVVCNSYQCCVWGEEQKETSFPFKAGQTFRMIIRFNPTEFLVVLPDCSSFKFPNRLGREKYSVIGIDGDACITSFEII